MFKKYSQKTKHCVDCGFVIIQPIIINYIEWGPNRKATLDSVDFSLAMSCFHVWGWVTGSNFNRENFNIKIIDLVFNTEKSGEYCLLFYIF